MGGFRRLPAIGSLDAARGASARQKAAHERAPQTVATPRNLPLQLSWKPQPAAAACSAGATPHAPQVRRRGERAGVEITSQSARQQAPEQHRAPQVRRRGTRGGKRLREIRDMVSNDLREPLGPRQPLGPPAAHLLASLQRSAIGATASDPARKPPRQLAAPEQSFTPPKNVCRIKLTPIDIEIFARKKPPTGPAQDKHRVCELMGMAQNDKPPPLVPRVRVMQASAKYRPRQPAEAASSAGARLILPVIIKRQRRAASSARASIPPPMDEAREAVNLAGPKPEPQQPAADGSAGSKLERQHPCYLCQRVTDMRCSECMRWVCWDDCAELRCVPCDWIHISDEEDEALAG